MTTTAETIRATLARDLAAERIQDLEAAMGAAPK